MKASGYYASNLTAEDIHEPTQCTIDGVDVRAFTKEGQGTRKKITLTFTDLPGALVLNKTNADRMIEKFGDETDDWTGKTITLAVEKVDFKGKKVDGLRIQ